MKNRPATCRFCSLRSYEEEKQKCLDAGKKGRARFWEKRIKLETIVITSAASVNYSHPCGKEHREQVIALRREYPRKDEAEIRRRQIAVRRANKALLSELNRYALLNLSATDTNAIMKSKYMIDHYKTLLAQRERRLNEILR